MQTNQVWLYGFLHRNKKFLDSEIYTAITVLNMLVIFAYLIYMWFNYNYDLYHIAAKYNYNYINMYRCDEWY